MNSLFAILTKVIDALDLVVWEYYFTHCETPSNTTTALNSRYLYRGGGGWGGCGGGGGVGVEVTGGFFMTSL